MSVSSVGSSGANVAWPPSVPAANGSPATPQGVRGKHHHHHGGGTPPSSSTTDSSTSDQANPLSALGGAAATTADTFVFSGGNS
jgi:hypothetical protein